MTKEEILNIIDNCGDINSPEMVEFKKKVKSDPELKALITEIKIENKSINCDILDTLYNGAKLVIESESKDTDGKFGVLVQYLAMPASIASQVNSDNFERISAMVNGFISDHTLSKEQNEKLIFLLDKLKNKSEKDLEK